MGQGSDEINGMSLGPLEIAHELLNKPEYFICERFYCRLRIEICIGRQKANQQPRRPFDPIPFEGCMGCAQGAKNMELEKSMAPDQPGKPKRGKGQRNEICEFYDVCLDLAAKKDWQTFNCEACTYYCDENKVVKEKTENTRICETESCERFTINPNNPFCASCLAKKSNAAKASKKKGSIKPDHKTNGKDRATPKKSILVPISTVEINFVHYEPLLEQIRGLATEEIRTPEHQILYLLKTHPKLAKLS